jgi:hypothetical protein
VSHVEPRMITVAMAPEVSKQGMDLSSLGGPLP